MAGAMEELDSAILLVIGAVADLEKKKPGHELLKFGHTFDAGPDDPEFLKRYGQGESIPAWARGTDSWRGCMYMNYFNALKTAINEE